MQETRETQVRSLGQEDPLEEEQPTPAFLPGKSHVQRSLVHYRAWGEKESDTTETTQQQRPLGRGQGRSPPKLASHSLARTKGVTNTTLFEKLFSTAWKSILHLPSPHPSGRLLSFSMSSFEIKRHAVFPGKTELFRDPATALGVILKVWNSASFQNIWTPMLDQKSSYICFWVYDDAKSLPRDTGSNSWAQGLVYTHTHTHTHRCKAFRLYIYNPPYFWIYFIETNYLLRPNPLDQKFAHKQ